MKRITIVSGIQLSDNPRVVKEAATLANAGYDVEVLCSLLKPADQDRNLRIAGLHSFRVRRVVDASRCGLVNRMSWQWRRLRRRLSLSASRLTGGESVFQLGYAAHGLLKECLLNPADLYSIHLPQAMWVGAQLISRGAKVSVDMEDWYSEDFRQEDLVTAPLRLLRSNESAVLNGAAFSATTSSAMSRSLVEHYGCRPPLVLHNSFRLSERSIHALPPHQSQTVKRLTRVGWVSQVIGPDRGLEQLVAATHYLKRPIEIHLTGRLRSGMEDLLSSGLHSASRIVFQEQVPHEELLALMQTYDIGFAGELAENRSRDLTVTNKLLHYFLAGIPAVCSDTQGQLEICRQAPEATRVYAQRDPASLAAAIDSLVENPEILNSAKQAAWDAGSTTFCWEANEDRLLDAVRGAIGDP